VTTHLENLEKSGNSKVVREKSGKMEKVGKWNQVCFQALNTPETHFSAGDLSRTLLEDLTMLSQTP